MRLTSDGTCGRRDSYYCESREVHPTEKCRTKNMKMVIG